MSAQTKFTVKDVLILISVIVNFGLLAYVVFRMPSATDSQAPAAARLSDSAVQKKKMTDAYLKKEVRQTVVKGLDPIQACYRGYLTTPHKAADGLIVADWHIDANGKVLGARIVSSQFQAPPLEECVLKEVRGWVFPRPPTGEATYAFHKFNFKKEESGGGPTPSSSRTAK